MAYRVALIAGSAKKLSFPFWARNLYTGSRFVATCEYTWFKRPVDRSLVLSGRHGAISMGAWIAPYDESLEGKSPEELGRWRKLVLRQLRVLLPRDSTFTVLADSRYANPLRGYLPEGTLFPFAGMSEDQQKQFLAA